jgi:hypothetical protein
LTGCVAGRVAAIYGSRMPNIRDTGVQWDASTVQWDGEVFYVHAKVFIEPWPAAWLRKHLAEELQAALGDENIEVVLAEAIPFPSEGWLDAEGGRHFGFAETGEILIGPFASMPEARVLRGAVDRQVGEAVSAARAADEQARAYANDLRQLDP